MQFEFCTTSIKRPEVLDKTYESFSRNLDKICLKDCRLWLNVDPFPNNSTITSKKLEEVARKYFGSVSVFYPTKCNFSIAIKKLWNSASDELIFHLEDDWVLEKKINIHDMVKMFLENPKLLQIRLRWFNTNSTISKKDILKLNKIQFGLSPCIIRKSFYKKIAKIINVNFNPEMQIRSIFANPTNKECVYYPNEKVISDYGFLWRDLNKINVRRYKIKYLKVKEKFKTKK
jgi:hypothetical protein